MDFIDLEASFEPPVVATDAEDPSVRVSKDSFVSSLVYLIGAHIIYEYYITYNIFVFALRLIQLFGLLQIKLSEARGRPIAFNKFRYTLFATHGFIFGLQLLYRPSSPLLLVFIGPVVAAGALQVIFVDLVMIGLFYVFLHQFKSSPS